ncbi:MAG: 2'-5' RNA ligase LigT [Roseibaca calidilacus]|uniref:RNA 2',3'-cyclic phosphodiesterase n=1 Tax=Roseibaca calidilacus TaxID=1666912 RepID=A0A0P7W4S4_9RHOB|nr:RNA 2',3'-cyclic phosphodiesterase [Roseibaca calidilacus]KPP91658.1 MAG: 2'-5' RNA ligase LigT [Roseibaca calidilacus]CUX82739.1 2'-5' RNA ligase [Roseibaca calidilacus]
MMRAFLGFQIPSHIGAQLVLQSHKLTVARKQPPENYHLTLVFLGEQPYDLLEELDLALQGFRAPAPWVQLAGLGLFGGTKPHNLHARVVPDPTLTHLHQRLEALARSFGVDFPRRKFTPHVTLAYLRPADFDLAELHDALARGMSFASEPFMPDTLSLFRVHQGKQGNRYEVVADYSLSNL